MKLYMPAWVHNLRRVPVLFTLLVFAAAMPGLHTSEESRWDYRVIIVRSSCDAPPGQSEGEVAKQLFPDQATFKQDENRRWELTANHWDLPIHLVKLDAAE